MLIELLTALPAIAACARAPYKGHALPSSHAHTLTLTCTAKR